MPGHLPKDLGFLLGRKVEFPNGRGLAVGRNSASGRILFFALLGLFKDSLGCWQNPAYSNHDLDNENDESLFARLAHARWVLQIRHKLTSVLTSYFGINCAIIHKQQL